MGQNTSICGLTCHFCYHLVHSSHFGDPELLPHGNRSWVRTSPRQSERSRSGWCVRRSACSRSRQRRRRACYGDRGSITSSSADSTRERCFWQDTIWNRTCSERWDGCCHKWRSVPIFVQADTEHSDCTSICHWRTNNCQPQMYLLC